MSRRGQLRVYLGAAPGVGKTYAMLDEGQRRAERGTEVVVGFVETHDRPHTVEQLEGLQVIARRTVTYRGAELSEMDLPAILGRHPQVVLVDEMAHTNVPGLEHEKRWQDIEELLEAGIDVISTVNVQHLESLNDVVLAITGIPQRETVPDSVVRAAEQVELVDMTPQALRRRMAHGNIYKPDKVDAALGNYFRPGNLTALRELALLWLADSVEEGMRRYREQHGIAATWETRERVVVALTGGPEGDTLIRRGARIAARASGGDLMAVHVARSDGLAGSSIAALERQRLLVESLGGSYHSVAGDRVANAVLDFARANNATQIVIGASRRNPVVAALTGPGTGMTITRASGPIDVHVVSHDYVGKGRVLPRISSGLTARRRIAGVVAAGVLLAGLTPICAATRTDLSLASDMLLFLLVVVIGSLIGGFYPALIAAAAASLLINYFLIPPIHTFTISRPENILAVIIFVLIAVLVSRVVDGAARRSSEAARSNAEAETLSTLAGSLLRGEQALPALLQRVQETFAVTSVALLRRDTQAPASSLLGAQHSGSGRRGTWTLLASVGDNPCLRPEDGDCEIPVGDDLLLVLCGRVLAADDQRLLAAFAAQVAVAYQQRRLADAAAAAIPLAETVTNLLDLSRVHAGVLSVHTEPVELNTVVNRALDHLNPTIRPGAPNSMIHLDIPDGLPEVQADAGLLERVVANLVDNALSYSPTHQPVQLSARGHGQTVELRVIDRGRGMPTEDRETGFEPFERREGHAPSTTVIVGLGLAISRSFTEAMRGTLTLDDTPGGGRTAVVALPAVQGSDPVAPSASAEMAGEQGP